LTLPHFIDRVRGGKISTNGVSWLILPFFPAFLSILKNQKKLAQLCPRIPGIGNLQVSPQQPNTEDTRNDNQKDFHRTFSFGIWNFGRHAIGISSRRLANAR
jgi:hypothetical protein